MHPKVADPTAPLPLPEIRRLTIPVDGLEEAALYAATGLTSAQVYPLLGDVLMGPRDYRYPSRPRFATFYFTAAGVRTLVDHFRLPLEVVEIVLCPADGTPTYHAPGRDTRPWWVREGLA
ncbi:MAG: hypothetical protein NDJ72_05210 [Elusimicrobia bacterium]|nr:hypothetical protein [Elusimicrobiota bacterium]